MMKEQDTYETQSTIKPRLRISEKPCPKCHSVIIKNEKEDCYECMNCGFIDCDVDD